MKDRPIQFQSADEFRGRDDYVPELRCEKDELDRIVGKYEFTEQQSLRCGLNGCNKLHWHGWVVRTKAGRETHCGRNCGEREFGVSWTEVEAEYRAAEERFARQSVIQQTLLDRGAMLEHAERMVIEMTTLWARVSLIRDLIAKERPLLQELEKAMKSDGKIVVGRQVDSETARGMGGKIGRVEQHTIATVLGIQALANPGSPVVKLRNFAVLPLRQFAVDDLPKLDDKALKKKTAEITAIRSHIADAERFLAQARQFCTSANMAQLSKLTEAVPPKSRRDRLRRIERQLLEMPDIANETA